MTRSVIPMIHVPDVAATAVWYQSIGFALAGSHACEGEPLDWARLSFGEDSVMLSVGGRASGAERREVDLYVTVDDIDTLHETLKDRAEVVEGPHDTEYGMREFIIRDPNRFWITFGQPISG
jgi:hypothetical protein